MSTPNYLTTLGLACTFFTVKMIFTSGLRFPTSNKIFVFSDANCSPILFVYCSMILDVISTVLNKFWIRFSITTTAKLLTYAISIASSGILRYQIPSKMFYKTGSRTDHCETLLVSCMISPVSHVYTPIP